MRHLCATLCDIRRSRAGQHWIPDYAILGCVCHAKLSNHALIFAAEDRLAACSLTRPGLIRAMLGCRQAIRSLYPARIDPD